MRFTGKLLSLLGVAALAAGMVLAAAPAVQAASNEQNCKRWCAKNPACDHCDTRLRCPKGSARLKTWKGPGKNWHACSKVRPARKPQARELAVCNRWCKRNPKCGNCQKDRPCGGDTKVLKKFRGKSGAYYACSKSSKLLKNLVTNKKKCLNWCKNNPKCSRCVTRPLCPARAKVLKRWTGKGTNYYACGKPRK